MAAKKTQTKKTPPKSTRTKTASTKTAKTRTEEFAVTGDQVVSKIKELIKAGNARKITIKNEAGKPIIVIPLTVGVVGTALLPVWAAVGAIAALVTNCTIAVEREEKPPQT